MKSDLGAVRVPQEPPAHLVDLAIERSGLSPCRSKRGVVIFTGENVVTHGYNYKPRGFDCDGSAACKATCRTTAVHAEQQALLSAGRQAYGAEMLHVKSVDGRLVPSGGPSCVQCSKLALAAGINGMWLYHADGWRRYDTADWYRQALEAAAPLVAPAGVPEPQEVFFLSVSGDGPTGKVLIGRDAVRRELDEQFFGPEGPQSDEHRAEAAARWASFCDADGHWAYAHGEPFSWEEQGEDYALSVTIITEPLPAVGRLPALEALRLHRCKICGTRWLLWPDMIHGGGWNLLDRYQRPGGCCDNVAMGDQIEHLRDFDLAGLRADPAPRQVQEKKEDQVSRVETGATIPATGSTAKISNGDE